MHFSANKKDGRIASSLIGGRAEGRVVQRGWGGAAHGRIVAGALSMDGLWRFSSFITARQPYAHRHRRIDLAKRNRVALPPLH